MAYFELLTIKHLELRQRDHRKSLEEDSPSAATLHLFPRVLHEIW
jgi:hypothetical protein